MQFLCVVVSLVADPLLIPWFHARTGNGGLGVCWANVASEVLMVAGGIALTPKGVFDRTLWRKLALALVAGGAMATTARALGVLPPFAAAPLTVTVYVACLWFTGALEKQQVEAVRAIFARKFSRKLA